MNTKPTFAQVAFVLGVLFLIFVAPALIEAALS
jgi:hypothetical protein